MNTEKSADKATVSAGGERAGALQKLWKAAAILIWIGIIVFIALRLDDFSVESIVAGVPANRILAAVVMLALFALKSLSIVMYAGLLYAANGVLFPIPIAILVNLAGSFIMVSLPYWIGKRNGSAAVEAVLRKYPKTERLHKLRADNDFIFAYLARMAGLPSDVVSLYMGAVNVEYGKYVVGSLLGFLPHMIIYPVIGMSIRDTHSTAFVASVCAELVYIVLTATAYFIYHKRKQKKEKA